MKPFDTNGAFNPLEEGGVRQLAVRGAGFTVLSAGVGLAIQTIATVVLARLLLPRDFGLVAMVTTFSVLLMNFGFNGFTEAAIQREKLDHSLASNLFWIGLGAGFLLTIGFAAAGSFVARFYHEPLVTRVAIGISPTIFLTSISVQHLALLKRAMRFFALSVNDIFARAVSVAVSIVLGWAGWGYWALVVGAIAMPLTTSIGAWFLCRWTPGRPRRAEGTGAMVRYAIHVYGRFTFNYFSRNTDYALVGWRFNARALGFYKKAYDLFAVSAALLVSSLTAVAVSALSRLNRDPVQYRRYFLSALAVVAFAGMGLGGDLTLVGRDFIRVLLGPGWEPAGQIFTYFGPGIGVMLLYGTTGWIHLSIGTPERWFRWGIFEFIVTVLLFVLGLRWGPAGVAMAWTVSFWILTVPAFWYAGRPVDFGVVPVIAAVWKYVLASGLAGCASAVLARRIPFLVAATGSIGAFIRIVTISALFGVLYLGAVILLHKGFAPLYQVAKLLREMAGSGRLTSRSIGVSTVHTASEALTPSREGE